MGVHCQQHIQTINKKSIFTCKEATSNESFLGCQQRNFIVVNEVFITRHQKESYVDKKFEEPFVNVKTLLPFRTYIFQV